MKPKYIRVVSDLHLEQYYSQVAEALEFKFLPPDDRDIESVLVLAGDISSKPTQLVEFIRQVEKRFMRVYYVPGNHEFYDHEMKRWAEDFTATMSEPPFAGELPITEFATLDMKLEDLEGVRFIFGTMWADGGPSLADRATVGRYLRDFYVIKVKAANQREPRRFTVPDMVEIHKRQVKQLEAMIETPFEGKTVVISHHMPSYRLCHPRFGGDANGGFASNLDRLLASDHAPNLWIHGHTHDTIDTNMWKTRVVCNPAGYNRETGRSPYNTFGTKFIEIATMNDG